MYIAELARRQCVREAVVTDHTADLFDEVDGTLHIRSTDGHGHGHFVVAFDFEPKTFERVVCFFCGVFHADDSTQIFEAEFVSSTVPASVDNIDEPLCARERSTCGLHCFKELDRTFSEGVDLRRVHTTLKAVGCVGVEVGASCASADAAGVKVRNFEDDILGIFVHRAIESAHHAGECDGLGCVGDDEVVFDQLELRFIEERKFFARLGLANDDLLALELIEVERVRGLAVADIDIVCDVDDIVERSLAYGFEASPHPLGRGAHRDVVEHCGAVPPTTLFAFDGNFNRFFRCFFSDLNDQIARHRRRFFEWALEQHGDFARDALNAETVAAVRCQGDIEDDVLQVERIGDGRAHAQVCGKLQEAVDFVWAADFGCTTEHAFGGLASELTLFNLQAVRHGCADGSEWREHTGFDVVCSADDLQLVFAVEDGAHAQTVGIWVWLYVIDTSDDDAVEVGSEVLDAFDFEAGEGQCVGELLWCESVEVDEILEPVPAYEHDRFSYSPGAGKVRTDGDTGGSVLRWRTALGNGRRYRRSGGYRRRPMRAWRGARCLHQTRILYIFRYLHRRLGVRWGLRRLRRGSRSSRFVYRFCIRALRRRRIAYRLRRTAL